MAVNVSKTGGIYIEISGDYAKLQADLKQVDAIAKAAGKDISDALSGALTPKTAASASSNLTKYLATASRAAQGVKADLSGMDTEFRKMGQSIGVAEKDLAGFVATQRQMLQNQSAKAFTDSLKGMQRLTGASNEEMNRLAKSLGGVGNEFTKAGRSAVALGSCIEDVVKKYGGMLLTVQALQTAATAMGQSVLQADRLNKSYTTIYDSAGAAQQQLGYLYGLSDELGLRFQSTAEAAKTFFAAGKGTALEGELNNIFKSVSSAGAALSLSEAEMQGIFLALGQMISKGKVQAEELRGQLGERLPGAFRLAAQAMKMTTAELDKFLSEGKVTAEMLLPKLAAELDKTFGGKAVAAGQGLQGQLNRFSTEWERVKVSLVDSDALAEAVGGVAKSMKTLADNGPQVVQATETVAVAFAAWLVTTRAVVPAIAALRYEFQFLALARAEVGAMSAATASLGSVAGKAKAGLSGLIGAMGGPWVLGITAAATAVTYLATQEDVAVKFAREHADAMLLVSTNANTAKQAMDGYAKKLAEMNAAQREFERVRIERERKDISGSGSAYRTIVNDITPLAMNDDRHAEIRKKLSEAAQIVLPGKIDSASVKELESLRDRITEVAAEYGRTKEAANALTTVESLIVLAKQAEEAAKSLDTTANAVGGVAAALNKLDAQKVSVSIAALEQKVEQAKRTATGQSVATALIDIGVSSKEIDRFGNVSQETFAKYDAATQGSILKTQALAKELYGLSNKAKSAGASASRNAFQASEAYERAVSAAEQLRLKNAELMEQLSGSSLSSALAKVQREYQAQLDALEKRQRELENNKPQFAKAGKLDTYDEAQKEIADQRELLESNRTLNEELAHRADLARTARANMDYAGLIGDVREYYAQEVELLKVQMLSASEAEKRALAERQRIAQARASLDVGGMLQTGMANMTRDAQQRVIDFWEKSLPESIGAATDSIGNAFAEMGLGTKSVAQSFEDMGKAVQGIFQQIIADFINMSIRMAMFGKNGSGGLLGGLVGSMFSGGVPQPGDPSFVGPLLPSAKGNVFSASSLSAYSNSIVSQPTLFPFAKGIGLMGEAGAEAIMPLRRGSGGRLGVDASGFGSGQQAPQVNVIVNTPPGVSVAEQEKKPNGQGGFDMTIMLEMVDKAMASGISSGRSNTARALSARGI